MANRDYPKAQGRKNQSSAQTRRTSKIVLSLGILGLLSVCQASRPAVSEPQRTPLIFTQFPRKAGMPAPSDHFVPGQSSRTEGSRLVLISPSGKLTVLTPEFAAAA